MLERVTLGQTRFTTPGVSTDARGVLLGKQGLALFASIEGIVRWLRLYGDEDSLDDLLPGLRIVRVVTALKTRACLLVVPASSSYVLDRGARCARLAGGAFFTGTARHFVAYRDERSPYGYDVVDLGTAAGADYVLHGKEVVQHYAKDGEVDIAALIFRLSLRRQPGSERLDAEARSALYVTVAAGLASGLIRYLLRYRVRAEVTQLHFEQKSAFAAPGDPDDYVLVRVHQLPERLLGGLLGVPGVCLLRPVGDNLAIEVGYVHPVSLTAASSIFSADRFYFFFGGADRLDIVKGPLTFSSAEHLGRIEIGAGKSRVGVAQPIAEEIAPAVDIRLVPTLSAPRRVIATLVDWRAAAHLKKLVYALPPALLAGHRVAVTDRGFLLIGTAGIDVIPLGTLLSEVAPGLYVPVGMDLVPRVATEVLAAAIEQSAGGKADRGPRITIFPHEGLPFFVPAAALVPLDRQIVARVKVPPATVEVPPPMTAPGAARIVNEKVGRFALWGFRGESD